MLQPDNYKLKLRRSLIFIETKKHYEHSTPYGVEQTNLILIYKYLSPTETDGFKHIFISFTKKYPVQ